MLADEGPVSRNDWRYMPPSLAEYVESIGWMVRSWRHDYSVDLTDTMLIGVRADVLCRTTWPGHDLDLITHLVERHGPITLTLS